LTEVLDALWPNLEFLSGYFDLLSNLLQLGTFGKDILTVQEQFAFLRGAGLAKGELARQDVAPL
jgi:hypothetical protein